MYNNKYNLYLFIIGIFLCPLIFAQQSPTGTWVTFDDHTGEQRAQVRVDLSGNILSATIIKVYLQPGDTGICSKCPNSFKNQPIVGLQFLWNLHGSKPGVWEGGYILDPKTGKIYRAKVTLQTDKLYVRGYLGLVALGRTQIWKRKTALPL